MFQFANPHYLYLLILIPVFVLVYVLILISRKKAIHKFGDIEIIARLMPLSSKKRPWFKFILYLLSLALLIIALARPQHGSKLKEVKTKGIEIIIALDISNSMLAEDREFKPNRLEAAKRAVIRLVDNLKDDKIGLVVFAGSAFMQVPVTADYTATKMMLASVNPGMISEQGTAIGDAINLAMKAFNPNNEKQKALIIISDGENHLDNPVDMAVSAAAKGISVFTIGIGDPNGSPIPVGSGSEFRKDNSGAVIVSRLDEEMLINIAQAGNGKYIRANSSKFGLLTLYNEIEKLEKSELGTAVFSEFEDLYQYLIFPALLLLLLDLAIMNRKNRYLEKFKLFNLRS
jgi:Ca-activated chloride channel homolog